MSKNEAELTLCQLHLLSFHRLCRNALICAALDKREPTQLTLRQLLEPLIESLMLLDTRSRHEYVARTSTGTGVDAIAVLMLREHELRVLQT